MNEKLPLPNQLLATINSGFKRISNTSREKRSIWQALDDYIHDYRQISNTIPDVDWPDTVFLPLGFWSDFMEEYLHLPENSFNINAIESLGQLQLLSCIAPWRATQDIVKFDPDVAKELRLMELSGKLPSEILSRLPAWCVWIDFPLKVEGDDFEGFFAHLDMAHENLCLVLTFQGTIQHRMVLPLGDFTLEEAISLVKKAENRKIEYISSNDPGLIQALNLVTYICAYGLLDRQDYSVNDRKYPKPVKTKKGWRIFPPQKPRVHIIGSKFGETIRNNGSKIGTCGTVRPHIRRPHWHHFWKGARGNKELIVHWLPPIFVGDQERYNNKNAESETSLEE